MATVNSLPRENFFIESLNSLIDKCIKYYSNYLANSRGTASNSYGKRIMLTRWIRKFHHECGTLNSDVNNTLKNLEDENCILLMTAHQPNLFAYGGVLRKATLNYVLGEKISKISGVPVVTFFGIADQDFADDRWVKVALLPDVERRQGTLELRFQTPEKVMLNRVEKPPRKILEHWQAKIEDWLTCKFKSVKNLCDSFRVPLGLDNFWLRENFESFWSVVEDAYCKAKNYSDFNAFVISKIVNTVWGYNTLFSRFSECQQIFESEFCFLLSNFDVYSNSIKELTLSTDKKTGGVSKDEYKTLPFWYHCACGGKVRLTAVRENKSLSGVGRCLRCGEKYFFDFCSTEEPKISEILPKISARSLSMPLIFFVGLGVCCYTGGVGGKEYLKQAKVVSEKLGKAFPPVIIWRPRDIYLGVGQIEALLTYAKFSKTLDLSKYLAILSSFEERISKIKEEITRLELQKKLFLSGDTMSKEGKALKVKAISAAQTEIRKKTSFSVLVRNLRLLENVGAVMNLHPCIIDYAVNVGLKQTSEQWVAFLKEDGNLFSDLRLKTAFDHLLNLKFEVNPNEELQSHF